MIIKRNARPKKVEHLLKNPECRRISYTEEQNLLIQTGSTQIISPFYIACWQENVTAKINEQQWSNSAAKLPPQVVGIALGEKFFPLYPDDLYEGKYRPLLIYYATTRYSELFAANNIYSETGFHQIVRLERSLELLILAASLIQAFHYEEGQKIQQLLLTTIKGEDNHEGTEEVF